MSNEEKPFKIFLDFEGISFDYYSFHRMEESETFNAEQPFGVDFNLIVYFKQSPYKHIFAFATNELREKKVEILKAKLSDNRIQFI